MRNIHFVLQMTKEDAIAFLQEIKFNIDYLKAHFSQNVKAAEESAQQQNLKNILIEQAKVGRLLCSIYIFSKYFAEPEIRS